MSDRIALVTGGMGGIGTAICQKLAQSGYKVAATYNKGGNHDIAKEWQIKQQKLGFEFTTSYCNVADYESCGIMVAEIKELLGPVSILVNNAGIAKDSTFKKMSLSQWQQVINTNLNSAFNVTSYIINDMLAQKYGRIINISSINGQKGQFGQSNYSASKAGLHGFTKSLSLEVARKGITVNTISPGYIDTDMMADVPKDVLDSIIQQIPVGRLGKPEEIANVVDFLSNESASFITGADISINGGQYLS